MLAHIFSYSWEYDVCVRYIIYWFDTGKSTKNNLKNDGIQLKNNKVDINRLNVDKLAETIIEQEKENTLIQEDNSLDTLTIENNRKDDSNEIIHSWKTFHGNGDC